MTTLSPAQVEKVIDQHIQDLLSTTGWCHGCPMLTQQMIKNMVIAVMEELDDLARPPRSVGGHLFAFTGTMPCTGLYRCRKCGAAFDRKMDESIQGLFDRVNLWSKDNPYCNKLLDVPPDHPVKGDLGSVPL